MSETVNDSADPRYRGT